MSPKTMPEMPEGFPVAPAGKYVAVLKDIQDRVVEGEGKTWDGRQACFWKFKIKGGQHDGIEVSDSTIMPFNADDTPVAKELRQKCFAWKNRVKKMMGGTFPKDKDWDKIKELLIGTEWGIKVGLRKWQGADQNTLEDIVKAEEVIPF